MPKIHTFRFSLHTSRLSFHGEVTIVLPKHFALFVPFLSNGASRVTSEQKPKTNAQTLPSPIIGSAEALPILFVKYAPPPPPQVREREIQREREREREREIGESDIIIVALKLAMSLHFPMPKIRTIAVSSHLPLQKSHFSFLPSRFLSHHCGAEIGSVSKSFWYFRKRGSASYIVREVREVRERERYRDRRKWRHDCHAKIGDEFTLSFAKIRTIGDEIARSLAKISYFSFPLQTSRLSLHHCGAEICNEFTSSVAKIFRPLSRFRFSQMAQAARQVIENPRQMIKSCSVPSKNWIKLIPKTIGNRKRDCAWGGSGW